MLEAEIESTLGCKGNSDRKEKLLLRIRTVENCRRDEEGGRDD